jgi:muramoyltetrapeptide carboxypeptidase LdcA involved in peptidoglycan recycling
MHKIKIIAPSSTLNDYDKALSILNKSLELFRQKGLLAEVNKESIKLGELPWYANSVEFRVNDLKEALLDENVRIIWAFRGGSSGAEVAELIDVTPTTPKVLIGFSDITVFHVLFNQKFNLPTIHGEVITRIIDQNKAHVIDEFIDIINNNKSLEYTLKPLNNIDGDKISGKLKGGNLKVITTLIGTDLHPDFDDAILILEDVNEKGYAIMRDLIHLRQAKTLDKVKAIIFGDFTGGIEADGKNYVEVAINHFAEHCEVPCFRIKDFGHDLENNPVILGAYSEIEKNVLSIINPFSLTLD